VAAIVAHWIGLLDEIHEYRPGARYVGAAGGLRGSRLRTIDADRARGWRATIFSSLACVANCCGAGLVATLHHRDKVGLSLAGVPGALGICWAYYGLYFVGEAATLLGVSAIRRVHV